MLVNYIQKVALLNSESLVLIVIPDIWRVKLSEDTLVKIGLVENARGPRYVNINLETVCQEINA